MKFFLNNKKFGNITFNDEIAKGLILLIQLIYYIKNIIELDINIFQIINNYNLSKEVVYY